MSGAVAAAGRADASLGHHPPLLSGMTIHSRDQLIQAERVPATTMPRISDTSIIHLYNVPIATTDAYLLDLCRRWGPVQSLHKRTVQSGSATFPEVVITFQDPQGAAEAMRHLHGGSLFDHPLRAQLRSTILLNHLASSARPGSVAPYPRKTSSDAPASTHRNLYILNLSLDMTNVELQRLFSVFGEVTHVCIMAVFDHIGRRRAFVDMATSEAAQHAIRSLSGTTIHGYRVEVSFALIQRSGVPVTDYPSTPLKRFEQASIHLARNPQASASAFIRTQLAIENGFLPADPVVGANGDSVPRSRAASLANLLPAFDVMSIPNRQLDLYVANLDTLAIVDDDDLYKLFKPYGSVVGARLGIDSHGYSSGIGLVRMGTPAEAEKARTSIQGRVMNNKRLSVTFSPPPGSPFHTDYNASPADSVYATPAPSMASSFGAPMSPQTPVMGYSLYTSPSWSISPIAHPYINNLFSSFAGLGIACQNDCGASTYAAYRTNHINRGKQPYCFQAISKYRGPSVPLCSAQANSHSVGSDVLSSHTTERSREGSAETTGTSVCPLTISTEMDIKIEDVPYEGGSMPSACRSVLSHDVFGPISTEKINHIGNAQHLGPSRHGDAQSAARKRCVTSDVTFSFYKGIIPATGTAVDECLSDDQNDYYGAMPRPARVENRRKSMSVSI